MEANMIKNNVDIHGNQKYIAQKTSENPRPIHIEESNNKLG
jgi:hypothetical protein